MKGNITITALEGGIRVNTKLEHVSLIDKLHILHAVSKVLDMDPVYIKFFAFIETRGDGLFEDRRVPDEG